MKMKTLLASCALAFAMTTVDGFAAKQSPAEKAFEKEFKRHDMSTFGGICKKKNVGTFKANLAWYGENFAHENDPREMVRDHVTDFLNCMRQAKHKNTLAAFQDAGICEMESGNEALDEKISEACGKATGSQCTNNQKALQAFKDRVHEAAKDVQNKDKQIVLDTDSLAAVEEALEGMVAPKCDE